ncbi:hypothetical protein PSTG_04087 [Puccinia striiformis f. sp. tritici PST-78]|uniref:Uncharacterized protein n=1 Tax=Puccinia striiformis f. sp. tritici PST-78 TaxID=1165861 RepID=A0A0L0VUB5_9BASI|nr:hypothetical protein PSTG_04087 [Puccinia striiformis f. sp. tritici PST-78]
MNIGNWKRTLEKHGLSPEFPDVLDGVNGGFDQGIPEYKILGLPFVCLDNLKSSGIARDKKELLIKKELEAGRMANILGPSVNLIINPEKFETMWDDFKTVSKLFAEDRRDFKLALFDWEKAYRQIPTRIEQWKYLLVKDFDGNFLVDTRITFGGVTGCRCFKKPADAWKLIIKEEFNLGNIFRWVDDNLFVKLKSIKVSMTEVAGIMDGEEGKKAYTVGHIIGFKDLEGNIREFPAYEDHWLGTSCRYWMGTDLMNKQYLSSIRDFTFNRVDLCTLTELDFYVLNGWQPSAVKGYKLAVQKFLQHKQLTNVIFKLLASVLDICNFCSWCGRGGTREEESKVSSGTLKKYIIGLNVWHDFFNRHGQKVTLMLKSSAKEDVKRPKKLLNSAVMLKHLLKLVDIILKGNKEDAAIFYMAIMAFWGMAPLGEFMYIQERGLITLGPVANNVSVSQGLQSASIVLQGAKTAKPGELQYIRLAAMKHTLFPVLAVRQRIKSFSIGTDSLFGVGTPVGRKNLTKYM